MLQQGCDAHLTKHFWLLIEEGVWQGWRNEVGSVKWGGLQLDDFVDSACSSGGEVA